MKAKARQKGARGFLQAADAIVACGACKADVGKPCRPIARDRGKVWSVGQVHIARRIRRLMLTARATSGEREQIEADLVGALRADGLLS